MKERIKQLLIPIAIAFILLFVIEIFLIIIGYNPGGDTFKLKVTGELLGEFDENLFWRLKDVKPNFKSESGKNHQKIMCLTDSVSVMYEGKGYPGILQNILLDYIPEKNAIVFNGGVPGYTSFQGLKYFTSELLSYRPDVVSVCYGWNDHWQAGNGLPDKFQRPRKNSSRSRSKTLGFIRHLIFRIKQKQYSSVGPEKFRRVSITDYENNLREIIEICKENDIIIILMTAPYLDGPEDWIPTHKEYNEVVRRIAREEKIPVVDLVKTFRKREDLFLEPEIDKCHYNWEGSKIVAQALADTIREELTK